MKNLNLFHSQGPHDLHFGVENKKRVSGKTRENVNVHIQLRDQEAIEYWVSHHIKDYKHCRTARQCNLFGEHLEIPKIQY